jgi:hypothetical protein
MATEKITQMSLAAAPLTGNEIWEGVQGGVTKSLRTDFFPPIGASYLTTSSIGALVGSRRLVAGSNVTLTDNGAGNTLAISAGVPVPFFALLTPASGTFDNVMIPGIDDYILDIDTAAGDVQYTGFVAQRDGQRLSFTNVGPNLLEFLALVGSTSVNQIRLPSDIATVQNQTFTIQYSTGAGKWLAV